MVTYKNNVVAKYWTLYSITAPKTECIPLLFDEVKAKQREAELSKKRSFTNVFVLYLTCNLVHIASIK
jgi:hypothetical protein